MKDLIPVTYFLFSVDEYFISQGMIPASHSKHRSTSAPASDFQNNTSEGSLRFAVYFKNSAMMRFSNKFPILQVDFNKSGVTHFVRRVTRPLS